MAVCLNKYYNKNSYYINNHDIKIGDEKNLVIKYNDLKKKYNNNDIIATLVIPNTNINTLITKGEDNKFYLTNSLKKEYSIIGSIFMDYRVNINSKQINIYGHNSDEYNIPFKYLTNYLNKDYINKNRHIYIESKEGTNDYLIYNVKVTKSEEHLNLYYHDDVSWRDHLNKMNKDALYEDYVEVSDKILVLQTCLLDKDSNYLIISAKKI